MARATIHIGLDPRDEAKLVKRLRRARDTDTLRQGAVDALRAMQRDLSTYPQPSRQSQPPRTEAQRRAVMAKARRGEIPYQRTGELGRNWNAVLDETPNGLAIVIDNPVAYGPLVQSEAEQVGFHQDTWITDEMVLDRHAPGLIDDLADALEDALGGR